jgi:hypothetical protein
MPDPNFKNPRERDEDYLAFVRTQPCCVCRDPNSTEAHHPRVGHINDGGPGMAQRASDKWALPLCSRHHRELHSMSEREFWASLNIDPLALALHIRARPR